MTTVIETGNGVRGANAYAPEAFVLAYLTERNRQTDWSAASGDAQAAAVVAATDYIDFRWGPRFKGQKRYSFDDVKASGAVLFAGLPSAAETLEIGDQVYTFVSSLTGAYDEVLIGADAAECAENLYNALVATAAEAGVTHGIGTQANRHVTAELDSATVEMEAVAEGSSGNYTGLDGAPTNVTLTPFTGGIDGGPQPLEWPRSGAYYPSGQAATGVPPQVKQAMAEYAHRALSGLLAPDPEVDDTGGTVKKVREKVGPIEEEREFDAGSGLTVRLRPYPAADRLLRDLVTAAGGTYR